MKYRMIIGVVAILFGPVPAGAEATDRPVTPGTIAKEARETIDATAQYTTQQKEAFQRAAQDELEAVQKQMAALQAKADKASASARAELQKSIRELEGKKETARKQLDRLKSATDATWSEVKAGVHGAIEEMNQSYQRVRSNLR